MTCGGSDLFFLPCRNAFKGLQSCPFFKVVGQRVLKPTGNKMLVSSSTSCNPATKGEFQEVPKSVYRSITAKKGTVVMSWQEKPRQIVST
jgi:hypothetical protein